MEERTRAEYPITGPETYFMQTLTPSFLPQVDTMLLTLVLGVKGFFDELSKMPKEIPSPWADEFIW